MIKIAICDDNAYELKYAAKLLEASIICNAFDASIDIVTTSQEEIYEKLSNNDIDVLFLDIEFKDKGINGIEFAKKLRKINNNFCLIFITGQFEYSLIAYHCKTFAYLLKPIVVDKIDEIVIRLKNEFYSKNSNKLLKINKDISLKTSEILYIERIKGKSTVYTIDGNFSSNMSLNTFESKLDSNFKRIHRSYIVNKDKILKIDKDNKLISFENNITCPIGSYK